MITTATIIVINGECFDDVNNWTHRSSMECSSTGNLPDARTNRRCIRSHPNCAFAAASKLDIELFAYKNDENERQIHYIEERKGEETLNWVHPWLYQQSSE
jgi:hypothetical protein